VVIAGDFPLSDDETDTCPVDSFESFFETMGRVASF
jgi:type VI protein secretion system component VasK